MMFVQDQRDSNRAVAPLAMGMLAHGLYDGKCAKMHNDIGPPVASALSGTIVV